MHDWCDQSHVVKVLIKSENEQRGCDEEKNHKERERERKKERIPVMHRGCFFAKGTHRCQSISALMFSDHKSQEEILNN